MPPNSSAGNAAGGKTIIGDERISWVKGVIMQSFALKEKQYEKLFDSDEFRKMTNSFFEVKDCRHLFVYKVNQSTLDIHIDPPKSFNKSTALYFMKSQRVKITPQNLHKVVTFANITQKPLESLSIIANEIYLPIVRNEHNTRELTDQMSKEVTSTFSRFLADIHVNVGHSEGKTRLPLPLETIENDVSDKGKIHSLETVVVTWTNQIKEVLKKDPELMFRDNNPGPLDELQFWENKAADLQAVHEQLSTEKVQQVIHVLQAHESQYIPQFMKLVQEVSQAKIEAQSNVHFLTPLKEYFQKLQPDSPMAAEFTELKDTFARLYHLIYLVWNRSSFYNTLNRLVILLREIANDVIKFARHYNDATEILNIEAAEAIDKLDNTLAVCGIFKKYYFAYKNKVDRENPPEKRWKVLSHALFHRLDQFLERCNDIKELIKLVIMFNSLQEIEIGGTKGHILTAEVRSIHKEFQEAFQKFKNVSYDMLDVDVKEFEDHFYDFKSTISELEKMLGAVLSKGFEDCVNVTAAFKLIQSFQGLLEREIIQQELEKNNEYLIASYREDLQSVQEQFQTLKNSPPSYTNMPPTSGALIWSQGLLDRIEMPIQKLSEVNSSLLQSDDGKDLIKMQEALSKTIRQFQLEQCEKWSQSSTGIGDEKLQQPLLRRDADTGALCNNFDPELTRLLKEVSYMEKLNANRPEDGHLPIPEEAQAIFEKIEVYRTQTGQLGIIANMYNKMHVHLLDVEKPLLQERLDKIDQTLSRGVDELTWKSEGIDEFIDEALTLVKEASKILFTLKRNVTSIESVLSKWKKHSLFERKETRTLTPADFDGRYKEIKSSREKLIRDGGDKIHKVLESSFETLGTISKESDAWKQYIEYVNDIVISGLCDSVITCLVDLRDQIDENHVSKNDANPLLEIQLRINFQKKPMHAEFNPRLVDESDDTTDSIPKTVNRWITDFYDTASYIARLDSSDGDYTTEVKANPEVQSIVDEVHNLLSQNAEKCFHFKEVFEDFAFLWNRDKNEAFEDFLAENKEALETKDYSVFEENIAKYEKIEEELATLPHHASVGWLRIDSRPIKNELKSLCSQWKATFTGYLANDVKKVLDEMYTFMVTVGKGLDKEVNPGDVETLKEVISHIREVKKRVEAGTKTGMFKPLQEIAELLKSHNTPLPNDIVQRLEEAPEKWNALHQKSLNKREKLSPLQDQEAKKLKNQVLVFNKEVYEFRKAFSENPAFYWESGLVKAYASIDTWNKKLINIEKQAANSRHLQELFELTVVQYRELEECRLELKLLKGLWDISGHVLFQFRHWMKSSFSSVDVDALVDETKKIRKKVQAFNIKVRGWNCFRGLQDEVQNMLTALPLVQELRSPAMRDRHWKELLSETNTAGEINPNDPNFSVRELLNLGLHDYVETVRNIVNKASKELQIETALTKIEAIWKEMEFTFEENEELKCMLLGPVDDQIEELEDNQVKLQNISSIRYVDYFIARVTKWQTILGTVDSIITLWKEVQLTWSNLYPIFVLSEDIRTQLPEDSLRFEGVDGRWRKLMEMTVQIPNVVECCTSDRIKNHLDSVEFLDFLTEMQEDLEKCEKALADYLETKRRAFPRFYFVSPADLVDILSKGSFPRQVMHHMSKLVDAIETLVFEGESDVSTGLISREKEEIAWTTPYECKGAVEHWLNGVLDTIRDTLYNIMGESHAAYIEQTREQWLYNFPAQVVIATSRMWFTSEVNNAFERIEEGNKNALRDYHKQQVSQIAKLTQLVQGKLSKGDRRKIITLITVDVHNRDVVQRLIDEGADSSSVFTWQSQLRYSWDDTNGCVVNIADATFNYNYEYIGNCGCLVITPLTDRCYITLTQSLRLIMGGAPAGPAGTGKTETTKDLSRALGNACYVFNCLSYNTLVTLGSGLGYSVGDIYDVLSKNGEVENHGPQKVIEISQAYSALQVHAYDMDEVDTETDEDQTHRKYQSKILHPKRIMKNPAGTTLTVRLMDGTELQCTADHRISVVEEDGSIVWKQAQFISPTDKVVKGRTPVSENLPPLTKLLAAPSTWNKNGIFVPKDTSNSIRTLDSILPVYHDDIARCSAICRLVGYMLSNGVLQNEKRGNYSAVLFVGEYSDYLEVKQDVQMILQNNAVEPSCSQDTTTSSATFSVKLPSPIACLLATLGCPVGSQTNQEWHIPEMITQLKEPYLIREFISGLWGGAGTSVQISSSTNKLCPARFVWRTRSTLKKNLDDRLNSIINLMEKIGFDRSAHSIELFQQGENKEKETIDRGIQFNNVDVVSFFETHMSFAYCGDKRRKTSVALSHKKYTENMHQLLHDLSRRYREMRATVGRDPTKELSEFIHERQNSWNALALQAIPEVRELMQYTRNKPLKSGMVQPQKWRDLVTVRKPSGDVIAIPVMHVEENFDSVYLYDLSVPGAQNFVANGMVTHNCSEQMDYMTLGKIFKGLAMTGTWGCFDEFNRVRIGVLSVVATQFKSILDAIRARKEKFEFQHEIIPLKPTCGVFITMNPGYKGRTELPENLKALFRPCAMIVPDFENICEIMLASEGFVQSKMLAKKFVTLYQLNKELLSKQDHYDWGLRAIKSVLVIAGSLKRDEPTVAEELILMRALRDTNLAKLSADDISIFLRLIGDLFPGLEIKPKSSPTLVDAIRKAVQQMNLQTAENDMFIKKVVQYKELLDVRHSVFILGPAGAGKSCVWKTLVEAVRIMGKNTWVHVMDPKAVTSFELYGYMHEVTRDWKDGLLSYTMREMSRSSPEKPKWIVLDGDIDSEWIESMNTVMDDNKVLTLASNERIPLTPSMRMIFEISHLKNATPATVSRAGILFINSDDIGWTPFKESWIETRTDDREKQTLERLFDKYAAPTLQYFHDQRKVLSHIVPIREINMIQTLCYLLEGLLTDENCPPGSSQDVYEYYFSFACVWAFGGAFSGDERVVFNNYWKKRFTTVKFPDNGTVFDYYVVDQGTRFAPWTELVEPFEMADDKAFGEIVVQTADTARLNFVSELLTKHKRPVLFVGTAGTGKTTVVKQKLSNLPDNFMSATINMNSMTDSASLQSILEQYIERKAGKRFAPPGRNNLVYFIDDLNMPARDKYGTQSAIALLRQHMDYGFWFNRSKMTMKEVTNVQYIAAMNPKAGSFTVDDRLERHFGIFSCLFPSNEDLSIIYGQILEQSFKREQFPQTIASLADTLVKQSILLHKTISKEFLPTATKFHYQFNLREISNLFQGMCLARSEFIENRTDMVKLWLHESRRVFSDRMLPEDLGKFEKTLKKVATPFFASEEDCNTTMEAQILFAPFLKRVAGTEKAYTLVPEGDMLKEFLDNKLADYNQDHPVMNLELFQEAVEHVCRICRILFNPRGNALLVGVGGSGKQSLSRLSSFICEYETYQITATSNYSMNDFKESLIHLYRSTGLKEKEFTFIITDSQIVNEQMLVYINDVLSSGNIPDLFADDQKEDVISTIQKEVRAAGLDYNSKTVCWDYFIEKVRNRLHVVLCFSPVGPHFRTWCRKFPAIINNTIIDWFHDWPQEALVSVATRFLADVELSDEDLKGQLAQHMAFVHTSVGDACVQYALIERRHNYTTPKSYLELISLYKQLLEKKTNDLEDKIERLKNGLSKLEESENKVSELEGMLKNEQVVVAEKQESLKELLAKVEQEKAIVEKESSMAKKEEEKTDVLATKAEEFASECKEDLAKAEPIVEAAIEALNTLDKKEIQVLKSFAKPKKEIARVTEAVLILISDERRATRKFTWSDAKKMMQNPVGFIDLLKSYDKDNIPDAKIKALQPYVNDPTFDPVKIKTISSSAAGLCGWVNNIVKYYEVYCEVEPKRQKLAEAEQKLAASQASLKKVQDKVRALQSKLDQLIAEYDKALSDQKETQERAEKTQLKLKLAGRLVGGLADEKVRWAESIQAFDERKKTLVGDVLLASAFLSYVGAFTKSYRKTLMEEKWIPDIVERGIPLIENIDPLFDVLTDEARVASWNNEGLPSDRVSIENGSIVTNCKRWPLLIDPQLQGVKWIKTKEEKNGLKVVQLNQRRYLDTIIHAIRMGEPVLIENIGETIDSILDPLLSQSYVQKGNNRFIQIGDKEIDYDPKFRLYIQTKLSNPHYRPEIVAQTTLLNFMVTEAGLEDQLLAVVVNKERPDLEEQRVALLRQEREYKITLKKCEDDLLYELTNAEGDPLENQALVENLETTKETARKIKIAVQETKETSEKINKSRLVYRPVSERGSMLYFLIDQLSTIDHMYQYSLEAFMVMFNKALDKAVADEDVEKRVLNIIESITDTLFNYVSRGLFERHKLIFSTMLCFSIDRNNLDKAQLDFLLRGTKVRGEERPENVVSWCSEDSWAAIQALAEIEGTNPPFSSLPMDMNGSWRRWKEWCEFEKPEEKPLPLEWKSLGAFEKLLVIRCLRPDRLTMAISNFVRDKIGNKYVDGFTGDLKSSFEDSSPTTPMFFILSPGVDPVKSVEILGSRLGYSSNEGNFKNVSLGEGQEPVAEEALEIAFRTGGWVMLNNLHLTPEWLPKLEKILDHYDAIFARQRMAELNQLLASGKEDGENEAEKEDEEADAAAEEAPKEQPTAETASDEEPEPEAESDDNVRGHKNFRVFLSAEPSDKIPIGILQRSIKITSEPPGGLRANLNRALNQFSDQTWDGSSKQTEFKAVMFALCFFHAVIVERKKFGPQGWNRNYPFNLGDLTTCVNVLNNYLEDKPKVPWDDLIYVFGEIMYGGHITDDWDRKLCMSYLRSFIRPELIETIELCPGFQSPPPTLNHQGYLEYIEENLPSESPTAFGLHPNAEIGFRTIQGENLLRTILEMQPRTVDEDAGESTDQRLRTLITNTVDNLPEKYNMDDIAEKLGDERTPYQNSFYQECEYMNELLHEIEKSLSEVLRGIDGELSISDEMQSIMESLLLNQVPEVWDGVSYPSLLAFDAWLVDLHKRCNQLTAWTDDLSLPKVVWISGLFNPQSFLTAIMQSTARKMQWPLDKMVLVADVTKKLTEDGIDAPARDGAYIHGLSLEGAAWDIQVGSLVDAKLKELYPTMPVMHIKAQQVDKSDPASHYECPVYKTQERGPHYIASFKLKTKEKPPSSWTKGGVALLAQT